MTWLLKKPLVEEVFNKRILFKLNPPAGSGEFIAFT